MQIPYYHINTFTNALFSGNPAAVCLLNVELSEEQMDAIALENQLPVTAFIKPEGNAYYIRWKTPEDELKLCGHGTLAAAWVLFYELNIAQKEIQFFSLYAGALTVKRVTHGVELDFPGYALHLNSPASALLQGLGIDNAEVHQSGDRLLVLLPNEGMVKALQPKFDLLRSLPTRGIVVSAPGNTVDFVSRTFYPHKQTPEDAVTGSSHCALVPYWAQRLGKAQLIANQVSPRGGRLYCQLLDNRVLLQGSAVTYSQGHVNLS